MYGIAYLIESTALSFAWRVLTVLLSGSSQSEVPLLAAPTVHRRYAPARCAGGSHGSLTNRRILTLRTSCRRWLDLGAAAVASDAVLPQNCNGEWHPRCAVQLLSLVSSKLDYPNAKSYVRRFASAFPGRALWRYSIAIGSSRGRMRVQVLVSAGI